MEQKQVFFVIVTTLVSLNGQFTLAAQITSPSELSSEATLLNFESMQVGTNVPITYSGLTISSSGNAVVRAKGYTQYPNIFENQYLGQGDYTYTLEFDDLVSEIGMGVFDPNYSGTKLAVYDEDGVLIGEIKPLPTGSPGGGFSTFLGFKYSENKIKKLVLTPEVGDVLGIDNVTFHRTQTTPLLVTIDNFGATRNGSGKVKIKLVTGSETETAALYIYRAPAILQNLQQIQKVCQWDGVGTEVSGSVYSCKDENAPASVVYWPTEIENNGTTNNYLEFMTTVQ